MTTDFTITGVVYPRVILLQSSTDTLKDVYLEVSRRVSVLNRYRSEELKVGIRA